MSSENEKQRDQEKEKNTPKEKLTVDEIVDGAKALGLKPTAASFLRGQLVNCSRTSQGKPQMYQLRCL